MRLKRLDISGFKSFVDPTSIQLDAGMTAIVGPNGCGKSNIVDAIRWVLGEHSARQLRGGVMEDLIFQGSDTRAPVGICDVELTFSVAKGRLSPPYHEMEEIRIRRRLVRDMGSDAFINGQPVRLKDIVDIFLDTGVSTRAYAIVEQGSIARMITAKPEERRQLLEEAAGVMKYRSRRKEAEQKMKSTQQNMERVLDLLEEVRRQCQSLKQQASRAERFTLLQTEHESISHQVAALRVCQQQQTLKDVRDAWKHANAEVDAAQAVHQKESLTVAQLRRSLQAHEEEVQQAQDDLRQCEQQLSLLQRQAERLSGERRLLEERLSALEQQIEEHEARKALLHDDVQQLQQQLSEQNDEDLAQDCVQRRLEVEMAAEHLADIRAQYSDAVQVVEKLKAQQQSQMQQQQHIENNLRHALEQQEVLQAQGATLAEQKHAYEQQYGQQDSALEELTMRVETWSQSLQAAEETYEEQRAAYEQAKQTRNQYEQTWRQCKGEQQELQAQWAQPTMSDDVRALLRQQGALWMDEEMPCVPEHLEQAVAAALRGHDGNAVLMNPEVRKACGAERMHWQQLPLALYCVPEDTLPTVEHHLAEALALPQEHPLYAWFAQVAVCADIQEVSTAPVSGCVVSLDGWCLTAEGWLFPPAKQQAARRLRVQRKLHEVDAVLMESEEALHAAELRVQQTESAMHEQEQRKQQMSQSLHQGEDDLERCRAQVQRLKDAHEAWLQRQAQWQQSMQQQQQERDHWQQQHEQWQAVDTQDLEQAEQQLNLCAEQQQQYEQQWQYARSALAHAEQAAALHQQTMQSLQRDMQRSERELAQVSLRLQQEQKQCAETQNKLQKHTNQHALDADLEAGQVAVDAAHQMMQQIRQQGSELQEALRMQERLEQAAHQEVQKVGQARQKIEMRQATEEARLHDMDAELQQLGIQVAEVLMQDWQQYDMAAMSQQCATLEQKLARFGAVNLLAIEAFKEASERAKFLEEQLADLEASVATLQETIVRIDRTTKQRFKDVFERTNAHFQEIFPKLFGGGRAELRLDSDDVLTAGVEVSVQPPGKRLQDMRLLSGGEKALTAVALVFSIFKINPAPFCILDEVDAPLDDANVVRFSAMIADFSSEVQFLAISHNKITMKKANSLIGVSMPEAGVSKIVSVDLEAIPEV